MPDPPREAQLPLSTAPWCAPAQERSRGTLAPCWVWQGLLTWTSTLLPRASLLLGWGLLVGGRASGGWVAVGMGMQCIATCTLLPALYLRVLTLLGQYRPCCIRHRTLRPCLQHWLLPSLSLLFLFSKIPICPHSPLPLNSIWVTAMCSGLQMVLAFLTCVRAGLEHGD